ncbi:phosphodiester glycosidase family protein [Plantactinospora sp. KBS50]|uniref:phosphodiester glycosidase family protein n=1 Tax=Plantactinospora sp. KBS50 TaxID=2024580 RepID=UPI0012FDD829|nr:phosphodiester glycosidase family protein [Plantactinospora sp. KBS50]
MSRPVPARHRSRALGPLAALTTLATLIAQVGAPPAVAASPVVPAPAVAVPAGANPAAGALPGAVPAASGSLAVDRHTERIAPGVSLTRDRSYDPLGFVDSFLLTADLTGPTRPRLLAQSVSGATRPTELADAAHAVAATNGDFFAINTTNAPIGGEVRDGEPLKADRAGSPAVGLDAAGVGRIATLFLEGTATVGERGVDLAGLNSNSVPADAAVLYTPDWGPGDRGFVGTAGPVTELEVRDGAVSAVRTAGTATPVPAGGYVLLAAGGLAGQLAGTPPGTRFTVDYHARSDAPSPYSLALGAHTVLVRDGVEQPLDPGDANNTSLKPRTAIGWTADRRLLLYVADGSSSRSRGLTVAELATRMRDAGARDAVMLDGGGSSQLVSRRPGDARVGVTNVPSDGEERPVPNGVGLVPPAGSGRLTGLDVRLRSDRVFPGLSRDVSAAGYDETYAPAPAGTLRWRSVPGNLVRPDDAHVLRGAHSGSGLLEARSGSVRRQVALRVLGPLDRLEADVGSLALSAGERRDVTVTGVDAEGFRAPIEPRDVRLDYDPAVLDIAAGPDGTLRLTARPGEDGRGSIVTLRVQGHELRIPVTVGLVDQPLSSLADPAAWSALAVRATASVTGVDTSDRPGAAAGERGLRLGYDFTDQPVGTSAAYAVAGTPLTVPAGAQRLALWVNGDGHRHWLRATMAAQGSTNVPFTFATEVDWTGWRRVEGLIPGGFNPPITLSRIYLVETDSTRRDAGHVDLALLDARVGMALDVPDVPDQPDPAVVEQAAPQAGRAGGAGRPWRFAVLSDTHVNADGGTDSYGYTQTARALDEIVAAGPDFVLLSGDGVDSNRPADFALFQRLIDEHLPPDIPLYWAVGNHESGASATGTLDEFAAATGRPTRQVFDHNGTRFVLLNSTLGSLRRSDWSQLPWLRQQLAAAADDRSVGSVVVAVHHPVLDPTGTGASQLDDPYEGQFLEQELAGFRARSGKQVALLSGHAHTAHVRRADGVLEFNAPVVGKVPYGDAGHGGFAAWSLVTLDPAHAGCAPDRPDPAGLGWFRAEVRPLLSRAELHAPPAVAVGATARVYAEAVDAGQNDRVVPMRYPMSVTWGGGPGLAIVADDPAAARARRRRDVVAVLDLRSGTLTGLRRATVTVTVRAGTLTAATTVGVT